MKDIDRAIKTRQTEEQLELIKLYFIPIIGFVAFMLVMVILVLPKINQLFLLVEESSSIRKEIEQKDLIIKSLVELKANSAEVEGQLSTINSIIPPGTTEVVNFRGRVTSLAKKNNLQVDSQRFSEIVDTTLSDAQKEIQTYIGTLGLQEVPSIFEVSGTFTNIDRFVRDLDSLDDFIVVKEMSLTLKDEHNANLNDLKNQIWILEIQLVKYQFASRNTEEINKIYLSIPPTAKPDEDVLQYLTRKSQD